MHGEIIGPDMLVTEYEFLPGGDPSARDARLVLWASEEPLWFAEPLETFPIQGADMNGECLLSGIHLQETHYTVGLIIGESPQAIASVMTFSPGRSGGTATSVGIQLQQSGPDALAVTVDGLLGNVPGNQQNWFGIWEGDLVPGGKEGCLARIPAKSRQSTFTQLIDSLPLKFDSLYTIAYGVGPDWTDIAATLTFLTEPY
jgi:hypothetical protein